MYFFRRVDGRTKCVNRYKSNMIMITREQVEAKIKNVAEWLEERLKARKGGVM